MATKITLDAGKDRVNQRRVQEDAQTVADQLNAARANNFRFVIFTDADGGKEFSIDPAGVMSIESE